MRCFICESIKKSLDNKEKVIYKKPDESMK